MHAVGLVDCLLPGSLTGRGRSSVRCGLIEAPERDCHRVDIRTRCPMALHGVYAGLTPGLLHPIVFASLARLARGVPFPTS